MPTYEYECQACDHTFEEFQSMSDKPLRKCPVCKKLKLRRLIGSGAGIIFKGSGFYETDYKRAGTGKDGKKEPAKDGSAAKPETTPSASTSATTPSASASTTAATSESSSTTGKNRGGS